MPRYLKNFIGKTKELRRQGKTYSEIKAILKTNIPKSTLSSWFKDIRKPKQYLEKVRLLKEYEARNLGLSKKILETDIAKIALAMLWLGEGFKTRGSFGIGSSDSRIINLFLFLLKKCYSFDIKRIRITLQCRADQNIIELEKYWMNIINIPKEFFYKARVDPRTIGKPSIDKDYKGVLRVDYFDVKIQDEIATLVNMLYNQISSGPEV